MNELSQFKVLFVCIENSCRSQMAEGFARELGLDASSAGSKPSGKVNQTALRVMQEKGINMELHRSKGVDALATTTWAAVITMGCGDSCPSLPARLRQDWALPDPKALPIDEFRAVRDEIEQRVSELRDQLLRHEPNSSSA